MRCVQRSKASDVAESFSRIVADGDVDEDTVFCGCVFSDLRRSMFLSWSSRSSSRRGCDDEGGRAPESIMSICYQSSKRRSSSVVRVYGEG